MEVQGRIILNTGNGKGKTTAALGTVFRALGHGQRVCVIQFLKGQGRYGERIFADLQENLDWFICGKGFVFISHVGLLQPCGFLDVPSGDLRAVEYDFKKAYLQSKVFNDLRNEDGYHGKCGICAFRYACGGCRARAYANTGDYLDPEPGCTYEVIEK